MPDRLKDALEMFFRFTAYVERKKEGEKVAYEQSPSQIVDTMISTRLSNEVLIYRGFTDDIIAHRPEVEAFFRDRFNCAFHEKN
jgi:hypothetical protein